jgi:hypothetical protein
MANTQHRRRRSSLVGNLATFFVVHLLADAAIPRKLEQGRAQDLALLALIAGAGLWGTVSSRNESVASASAAITVTAGLRTARALFHQATHRRTIDTAGNWISPTGHRIPLGEIPPLNIPGLKTTSAAPPRLQ